MNEYRVALKARSGNIHVVTGELIVKADSKKDARDWVAANVRPLGVTVGTVEDRSK